MENTTIELTNLQKYLVLFLLREHIRGAVTTRTDQFISHEIINKLKEEEI